MPGCLAVETPAHLMTQSPFNRHGRVARQQTCICSIPLGRHTLWYVSIPWEDIHCVTAWALLVALWCACWLADDAQLTYILCVCLSSHALLTCLFAYLAPAADIMLGWFMLQLVSSPEYHELESTTSTLALCIFISISTAGATVTPDLYHGPEAS